jgi:hypothetical protein
MSGPPARKKKVEAPSNKVIITADAGQPKNR